jgi:hypothetical protein
VQISNVYGVRCFRPYIKDGQCLFYQENQGHGIRVGVGEGTLVGFGVGVGVGVLVGFGVGVDAGAGVLVGFGVGKEPALLVGVEVGIGAAPLPRLWGVELGLGADVELGLETDVGVEPGLLCIGVRNNANKIALPIIVNAARDTIAMRNAILRFIFWGSVGREVDGGTEAIWLDSWAEADVSSDVLCGGNIIVDGVWGGNIWVDFEDSSIGVLVVWRGGVTVWLDCCDPSNGSLIPVGWAVWSGGVII